KKEAWVKAKNYSDQVDMRILSNHVRETEVGTPKFVKSMPEPNKLDFVFPKPDKDFELENGLRVVICKNGDWPVLSMNCRFRDSTFLQSSKDSDLITLMMSLLIEGSEGYSKDDNIKFFENFGASCSFFGGGNLSILSDDSQPLFERFFHVLTKPSFPADALEKFKNISVDELLRSKDEPMVVAFRLLINLIYKEGHPYHWEFDEAIELIKTIGVEKLKEFHKKYVNPKNMILTVVGNFDLDQMEKTVKNVFGNWAEGEFVTNEFTKVEFEANQTADEHMLRDQVALMLGQPNDVNIYNPDATALKLLNTICFESMGSRLWQLREQSGLFYMAFGSIAGPIARVDGFDFVCALLSPDKTEQTRQSIINLINEFARDGIKQEELDYARQQFLKRLIDFTSNNASLSGLLNTITSFDFGFDYYDKVLKEAQDLTVDKLNEVAKKYFTTEKLATVRVGRIED
ncbi:MAG: pitrilysin family protein, partial [bacterium]